MKDRYIHLAVLLTILFLIGCSNTPLYHKMIVRENTSETKTSEKFVIGKIEGYHRSFDKGKEKVSDTMLREALSESLRSANLLAIDPGKQANIIDVEIMFQENPIGNSPYGLEMYIRYTLTENTTQQKKWTKEIYSTSKSKRASARYEDAARDNIRILIEELNKE